MTQIDPSTTPTNTWRNWLPTLALLTVALALPALGAIGLAQPIRSAADALRDQTLWSAPLFITAAALLAGTALLPTHAISLAAGYIFGVTLGTPLALAAVLIATTLGVQLAKRLGSNHLRQWVDQHPTARRLTSLIDTPNRSAILAITLLRLPPQVPFALANALAALLNLPLTPLLIGTALGMLPRVALVTYLGSQLAAWDQGTTSTNTLLLALASATIALLGLSLLARHTLRHTT
ncbi:MAG: VTT domain-containing protein [Phycisphaeraceae bacterium]